MNKTKLYVLAVQIFDTTPSLGTGWGEDERFENLDYWDKVYVSRIINNLIRQEYY